MEPLTGKLTQARPTSPAPLIRTPVPHWSLAMTVGARVQAQKSPLVAQEYQSLSLCRGVRGAPHSDPDHSASPMRML